MVTIEGVDHVITVIVIQIYLFGREQWKEVSSRTLREQVGHSKRTVLLPFNCIADVSSTKGDSSENRGPSLITRLGMV